MCWHAIVGESLVNVNCRPVSARVAAGRVQEGIVTRQTIDSQRLECVRPHAAPPIGLRARHHGTVFGSHGADRHISDASAPYSYAIIT